MLQCQRTGMTFVTNPRIPANRDEEVTSGIKVLYMDLEFQSNNATSSWSSTYDVLNLSWLEMRDFCPYQVHAATYLT